VESIAQNIWLVGLVVFGVGGWVITDVVKAIATNWRRRHESEHLAALKQSMVERGMTAEEMVRVLDAGRPAREPMEYANENLAYIVGQMMRKGKSTDEIERIINAWHGRTKAEEDSRVRAEG
jgi:hypothetical protein